MYDHECPGGPFMDYSSSNPSDFSASYSTIWNYGKEVWCNKEGRYTTIEFDYTHLSGGSYELSICSVGLFGTAY